MMDNFGNTPLHWAAGKNQAGSVKFLLNKGANPNLRNSSMMAPLHIAVQSLHNEVVKVRQLLSSDLRCKITVSDLETVHISLFLPDQSFQDHKKKKVKKIGFLSCQLVM